MLPRLIINYKTYDEGVGKNSIRISKKARKVKEELDVEIAVVPSFIDLKENSNIIKSYAQSLEAIYGGSYTGHITLNQILSTNAKGVLLNHSEKRIERENIISTSKMAKRSGLEVVVCVESVDEAIEFDSEEEIDAIAFEPRELIGSGRAVSKEKPKDIEEAANSIKKPLYVGAGITSKEDVVKSIELGAYGVLVASSIVKAENIGEKIRDLAAPLSNK